MMKLIMKRVASVVLATALVVSGAYCGGNSAQAAPKAKKIVMNKKSVTVSVGGKFTLKVKTVKPKKASKAVTYKVKNKKIATVSKKGVIKGKKVGSTKITVTSKSNKKVKATVKVKVTKKAPVTPTTAPVTPTTAPVVVPTPTAPVGGNVSPSPTPTKTPRPKKTPGPTASPTPEPTPPSDMKDAPSAPYSLVITNDNIADLVKFQGSKATCVVNEDGTWTISNAELYGGISFEVPADLEDDNFDTVTVKYKDVTNIGSGYGCGLWRLQDDKTTETVISYAGIFASTDEDGNPVTEGEYIASLKGDTTDQGNTWFVRKLLLFHNDESVHTMEPSAQVTIESIIFSHSEYEGPDRPEPSDNPDVPTPSADPEVTPSPSPDFTAVKVEAPFVIDGMVEDAWADIEAIDFASKIGAESATTATAKLAWDANNLYGLVTVADADINAEAANDYERDGIEFFLDEDNDAVKTYEANTDAFQYRFTGLTKDEDGNKLDALTDGFAGGSEAARTAYAGIETEYTYTEDGYVVEFKIPFVTEKAAGAHVGFDSIVQDCKAGGTRDGEIYLGQTDAGKSYYNLADTFKVLELVEAEMTEYELDLATDFVANSYVNKTVNEDGSITLTMTSGD